MGTTHVVAVIGGGPAGVAAVRALRDAAVGVRWFVPDGRVTYLPGTVDVALGRAGVERFTEIVKLRGVEVDGRLVEAVRGDGVLVEGSWLAVDAVIAAPGLALRPAVDPGRDDAVAFWDPVGAVAAARAVARFSRRRVAVVVAGLPYRCPPAPFGLAMRLAGQLRASDPSVEVVLTTPEDHPLAQLGPEPGRFLLGACADAGVEVRLGVRPDPEALAKGRLELDVGGAIDADLLLVVPTHGPSPLLVELAGDGPMVPVGPDFASAVPGLHVVGDAAATPFPRAAKPAAVSGAVAAIAVLARLGLGDPPPPAVPTAECYVGHTADAYSRIRLSYPGGPPPRGRPRVDIEPASAGLAAEFRSVHRRWSALRAD